MIEVKLNVSYKGKITTTTKVMNVWRGLIERGGLLGKGRKLQRVVIIIKNINFIYVEQNEISV